MNIIIIHNSKNTKKLTTGAALKTLCLACIAAHNSELLTTQDLRQWVAVVHFVKPGREYHPY